MFIFLFFFLFPLNNDNKVITQRGNEMKKLKIKLIKMIQDLVQRMTEGELNPLQTMRAIDARLKGVNYVKYGTGPKKSVKIKGKGGEGNIRVCGDRKTRERLIELAVLGYRQAQLNGNYQHPGEVHVSAELSSKHHQNGRDQFRDYTEGLVTRYSQN